MAKRARGLTGPISLFRRKVRAPVSITLTERHHQLVATNMWRLGLTRADFIGLLIDKYADVVKLPAGLPTAHDDEE